MKNAVGREIPEELIKKGWEPFQGNQYREGCTYQRVGPMVKARVMPQGGKVVSSLREAIEKTGLCDGMTISFHHHFRDGDYIVDKVMREIADMGLKDIHLATTSIGGAADVVAELGTMKDGGILPDSYPEGAEPDDDFLMLSDAKVSDGDRVLLIWTDAEEIVVIGKVEGDEEDAG